MPENVDGKAYMDYQRFRLRVWICSGISMLIVLSAAVALIVQILNFSTFLSQKYDLAEGDMRMISVSTAFCEKISLGKAASRRNLLILSSLRLDPQLRRTNTSTEVLVSKFKYWYKGFYLLEGSSVVISAESDSLLKPFIFKDKKRLNEWIDQNDDPLKASVEGDQDIPTSSQPTRIAYTLDAKETGNYFILFKYAQGTKDYARMKLDLNINRKVYDLESSVYSCSAGAGETCSARLLFGSSEVGVLEITDETYHGRELAATWSCKPRIWFYLAVFVGPILLAVVASFVFYFVFISRKRDKHLHRLALHRQEVIRRATGAGRSSSVSNRSLNGSMRRPPSRTPSTRSLGNQTDMSRAPCLQPVVTTMYTGNLECASEDSGHDTDEENKANNLNCNQTRKSSLDGVSLDSRETTVSRKPSFSTFQGSEDERCDVPTRKLAQVETVASRNPSGRSRDSYDGKIPAHERASSDRLDMRDKIPTGTIPKHPPTRRYSSDELHDRTSKTLPYNCGILATSEQAPHQFAQEVEAAVSHNSSGRLRDIRDGRRSSSERARKPRSDRHEMLEKIPSGTVPRNSPTRRYSSDELYDRKLYEKTSKTLPRNHGNVVPSVHPSYQLAPEVQASTSRNLSGRLRDSCDDGRSASKKARKPRKPSNEGRSDRHDSPGKIPNGTIPTSSPTRRYSSDELYDREMYDRTSKTLPRDRGNSVPVAPSGDQLAPERYLLPSRHSSLPSLQNPDGAWGLPLPSVPDYPPQAMPSSADGDFYREEYTAEPQKIKMRTHSGRRREFGWTPRLSMVSESEV